MRILILVSGFDECKVAGFGFCPIEQNQRDGGFLVF